jgi:hypothetical protein
MNSQELRALQEAYSQVYGLDEVSNAKVAAVGKARQKNVDKAFDKLDDSRGSSQNLATAISKQQKNQRLSAKRDKRNEAVDLYNIILSHLLDEGYADTEQAATAIMVNMSEDWRESIVEEVLDEDANYDKNRKRAAQRAAARNAARDAGKTGAVPGVGYVTPRRESETYRDSTGTERHKSGAKMPKKEDQKEQVDLYDIILSHLLDEGYADTEQAAEAIMVNMSEDWRESIVEEVLDEELSGSRKGKASEILNRKLRDVETLRNLAGRKRTQKTDYGSGNKAARKAGKEVKDSRVVQSDN